MLPEPRALRETEFPSLLKEIPDAPKELWVVGALPPPTLPLLAVVGSRAASPYGRDACTNLVQGLAGHSIGIVSGLALGIDGIAHNAALAAGLPTFAVPGSGLSHEALYPRSHVGLAERIVAEGGGLLSEYPPDFHATTWSFPRRNRIMAGLCRAVLLVEAGEKSGTLITARLAADYNRDVLVVPGNIFSPGSAGTHQFLKLGAIPVTSADDILDALGISHEDEGAPESDPTDLSPHAVQIWDVLGKEALDSDALAHTLHIPIGEIFVALSEMEIRGLIRSSNEGYVRTRR